eukprot:scaffold9505_cov202-Alexandrium_tamarense.AAC.6
MLLSSVSLRNLTAIASRPSSRQASTLLRPFVSTSCTSSLTPTQHGTSQNHPSQHHVTSTTLANNQPSRRTFSSMGMMPRRGFPQYTVFGPDSALSVRAVLPNFKRAGTDGISVDRRGKIVLEFVPRNPSGAGFQWADKTTFSMSVEEVGLFVSQLPQSGIELSHSLHYGGYGSGGEEDGGGSGGAKIASGDMIEKVLTVEPGEASSVKFKIDYMKNGVGGQTPPGPDSEDKLPVSTLCWVPFDGVVI